MKNFKILFAVTLLACSPVGFGQNIVEFSPQNWQVVNGRFDTIAGRRAFAGTALVKDVEFLNGTIEWDIWVTGGRSYAGILFRLHDNGDYEDFYIRPHKGNGLNADAFQYTPVFHNISCWQLFHGKGYTREAVIPAEEWLHFKMVVKDQVAIVSMTGENEVTMVMETLELDVLKGGFGVKSPVDGSAWFSGFKYSHEADSNVFPPESPEKPETPGIIKDWKLSQSFPNNIVDQYASVDQMGEIAWIDAKAGRDGLVNVTELVRRDPVQPGWVYAKTIIESESDGYKRYIFGYSDYITVFINGQPLFSGINGFTTRDPGYAGLIGYYDEVFLPVKKGSNELTLLIGEQFGGCGFMMKDATATFIEAGLIEKWSMGNTMSYPESALYDSESGLLFVSNFLSNGGGFISRITTRGEVNDVRFSTGFRSPTGLAIMGDYLYVVDRGAVVKVDKKRGDQLGRIRLEGSLFPNDIVADLEEGTLYVTDNDASIVYRIKEDIAEVWLDAATVNKPNGIELAGDKILLGCSGTSSIIAVDKKTKEVNVVARIHEGAIMDGIKMLKNGTILFSDYNGYLFSVNQDGEIKLLLNTITTGVKLADFEYIEKEGLLVIPGLYSNALGCYSF